MKILQGLGISPGIAIGPAFNFEPPVLSVAESRCTDPQNELERLLDALEVASRQIEALYETVQNELSPETASIIETQQLFLQDPDLLSIVNQLILQDRFTAEYAWFKGVSTFEEMLSSLQIGVFAERSVDLYDVGQRVLRILLGKPISRPLNHPSILFSEDLAPSIILGMDRENLLAFCTAQGSLTSHVAILSRAMGIPAVAGIFSPNPDIENTTSIIVDGQTGTVIVDPDTTTLEKFRLLSTTSRQRDLTAFSLACQPAITRDQHTVPVSANIGSVDEAVAALQSGADGIGLFRTEYLFLGRKTPPSEEDQYQYYTRILHQAGSKPVTARTVDLGGDKPVEYIQTEKEANPFLGLRGTRLALKYPHILRDQLCALLRASVQGNLKIMFPLVSSIPEALAARELLDECRSELERRSFPFDPQMRVGVMIETPAAAMITDFLLNQFDFCSIGTNDLVQYTLAADRTNPAVSSASDALDPAVVRLIDQVIRLAHVAQKKVSLCGELAGDPTAVPLLLGLHLDEFSLNGRGIPLIKDRIRRFTLCEAEGIAAHVLSLHTVADIRKFLLSVELK